MFYTPGSGGTEQNLSAGQGALGQGLFDRLSATSTMPPGYRRRRPAASVIPALTSGYAGFHAAIKQTNDAPVGVVKTLSLSCP